MTSSTPNLLSRNFERADISTGKKVPETPKEKNSDPFITNEAESQFQHMVHKGPLGYCHKHPLLADTHQNVEEILIDTSPILFTLFSYQISSFSGSQFEPHFLPPSKLIST